APLLDQRLPELVQSSPLAPPARNDGSADGNMSTFSKPFSAGSTSIRRRCASAARRSNILSDGCSRNPTRSCGAGGVLVHEDPLRDMEESVKAHRHQIERWEPEIHRIVFKQPAHDGPQQIQGHDPGNVAPS